MKKVYLSCFGAYALKKDVLAEADIVAVFEEAPIECGDKRANFPVARKPVFRTTVLGVDGMTCASCVGAIEGAMGKMAGVDRIEVNLVTKKATIHHAQSITAQGLKEAIDDLGFDASLPEPNIQVINIDGMTCASCVKKIEQHLCRLPGVVGASVNLMAANARVETDPTLTGIRDILEAVRELGYAPSLPDSQERGEARDRRAREVQEYKRLLAISLVLTVPVALIGMVFMHIHAVGLTNSLSGDW